MSRSPLSRVSTAVDRDSELALVERLRQGDGEAFDEVYAAFNTRVFTFLVRLSRRRDVAEDLLEETWVRLVKHARRLRPDTRLGPWLFTVARNLHVSYRRSRMLEDSAAASLMALWPFSVERSSPFEREDRVYQGTAGEGIAVDADGNVFAAEGPNSLVQAGGAFTKYSVK